MGMKERSPPGSRVVGTESPLGRCKMKFTAWIKPKQAHNRLVNTILQLPVQQAEEGAAA